MVRFSMNTFDICNNARIKIYIPLWLDFQFIEMMALEIAIKNLHSTMVRFSIDYFTTSLPNPTLFTFHYG